MTMTKEMKDFRDTMETIIGRGVEIYGKIIVDHGTEVVIEDEDAETEDNHLCFKKSEVEEIK